MMQDVARIWDMNGLDAVEKLFLMTLADSCHDDGQLVIPAGSTSMLRMSSTSNLMFDTMLNFWIKRGVIEVLTPNRDSAYTHRLNFTKLEGLLP